VVVERLLFGVNVLMSFASAIVVAALFVAPRLRILERERALALLVLPHLFLRFIGIGFLVPGVTGATLPAAFALPAAFGDLVAGLLAIVAIIGLARRASWALPAVWVFNLWGAADLLLAYVQGGRLDIPPGAFGATFYSPTAIAPPMLVTHFLVFRVLTRRT
jgi:hypothetical protein